MRSVLRPRSSLRPFAIAAALALSPGILLAQVRVTGRVTSDVGVPLPGANVRILALNISIGTNEQGAYTIDIPAARVTGQTVELQARSFGFLPVSRQITLRSGTLTENFSLKTDVNRLSEVVVTGVVGEAVERAKVPYAVSRLTAEEIPVPALNPITALQGKMPGVRIAQTSGRPGATPEIMMRGPTSINAQGRGQGPLFIVDGVIMRVGSLEELGGVDIESVEVVKGAAGASLYGTTAANGVIVIKTKRGANQDGVKINVRSEYGFSDVNSLDYGQPVNHHLQLDETGKRFCVNGSGNIAGCSRTFDWMTEILRINNVNADTVRTPQSVQYNAPALGSGDLLNVFQANIWPNQYYDGFAQVATYNPISLTSIDATGRTGGVRYFVSGSYSDEQGAIKGLKGQQQRRGRVNLDYNLREDMQISVSSVYDKGTTDDRSGGSSNGGIFGQLLRGAPAGTNYLARDTLGRPLVRGGGAGLRGSGNGGGTFLYDMENLVQDRESQRFIGSASASYFPADWVTLDANFGYDNRTRTNLFYLVKGYRTFTSSTSENNGQISFGDITNEAFNASLSASFRRQLMDDLRGKLSLRTFFDREDFTEYEGEGEIFLVKDVFTLDNASENKDAQSQNTSVRNMGAFAGASFDYKDRYILEGTFRYDGSSLFGSGERWAPFGRISGVWIVSQEPFWNVGFMNEFRVRASRGTAGSTPRFNAQYEVYNVSTTGITLGQSGNSKLKPETTTEVEIGADFTLFNRVGVEITNARGVTRDQILPVSTPAALGFSTQWQNAGTLENKTWEVGVNLPVINRRNLNWTMRGTWDRTRTYITELFTPEFVSNAGTGQGTGSLFRFTADRSKSNGFPKNRYGNVWGRRFYRGCGSLPSAVQSQCGEGRMFQVNDQGWVVYAGEGNSWRDGITKNLWQTKLSAADSPWNVPLWFGHPIIDRPLRGEPGEGVGIQQIIGNVMPDFRFTYSNNLRYKRLTVYALLDGTIGHEINNQGEGWGLFDFNSSNFDWGDATVETAKPVGYGWRVGAGEGVGSGGFYDQLGPNNYNVEEGSYAKLREVSLSYHHGAIRGLGDFTFGLIGRNLATFTGYSGYDPEVGANGSAAGVTQSGLINQVDAFGFPTLRSFTFTLSTRF
jgi:TonB-linked SusC/RagA family outer membrane protein